MTPQEQKEQKAVDYLRAQIDFGNPEVVLRVYKQVLEQGLFETEVGLGFLSELQAFLLRSPDIDRSAIPMMGGGNTAAVSEPTDMTGQYSDVGQSVPGTPAGMSEEESDNQALEQAATREAIRHEAARIVRRERALSAEYRRKMYIAIITAVVFFVMMVAMLVITLTSNLPTIINYRHQITDQYESWENDLNEREEELRKYEESLGLREPSDSADESTDINDTEVD